MDANSSHPEIELDTMVADSSPPQINFIDEDDEAAEGHMQDVVGQLNDFLSTEVNIDNLRLAREYRTQRPEEVKIRMAFAASPVVTRLADGASNMHPHLDKEDASEDGHSIKIKAPRGAEILDSDYSEESEDMSEGYKSAARHMTNMVNVKKLPLRAGSQVPMAQVEPRTSPKSILVPIGTAEFARSSVTPEITTEAWIAAPADEHPNLAMQFGDEIDAIPTGTDHQGGSANAIRKIPQLPSLGPSASLWRQRGFPDAIREPPNRNSGLTDTIADHAYDNIGTMEPIHWRSHSRPRRDFSGREQSTNGTNSSMEFVDVSNPYVRALRAHREEIMRNTVDLQEMSVDSLPSRLATQRTDALATLKTHEYPRLEAPLCGPRCSEGECTMTERDRGEFLFLEAVHEDKYKTHSWKDGYTPRLPLSARAGRGELHSIDMDEAIDEKILNDSSAWTDMAECQRVHRASSAPAGGPGETMRKPKCLQVFNMGEVTCEHPGGFNECQHRSESA